MAATNPYAAPQAELAETSPSLSKRDVLLSVALRRRVLIVLGAVRMLGGMGLVLWAINSFELLEQLIGTGVGIVSFLAGIGLALRHHWGRRTAIVECGVQVVFAVSLIASIGMSHSERHFDLLVLQLCVLAWNSSYLRIMLSPVSRSACNGRSSAASETADSPSKAQEKSWISIVLAMVGVAGVIVYALVGGMLSLWNLQKIWMLVS